MQTIKIDGLDYMICSFTQDGQSLCLQLLFSAEKLRELSADGALLIRARNGYISDLKEEILKKKTGVDMSSLLEDDYGSF
jgi:hypothetical protein